MVFVGVELAMNGSLLAVKINKSCLCVSQSCFDLHCLIVNFIVSQHINVSDIILNGYALMLYYKKQKYNVSKLKADLITEANMRSK